MAWTSPMTFTSGAVLTAAQLNTHLRDNLNETAPAKATVAGRIFVSTGANAIAERVPTGATVATVQSTSSLTYTDLTTVGPAVTVTTGTRAIVFVTCGSSNNAASGASLMSYAVSGATTIAAADGTCCRFDATGGGETGRFSAVSFVTTLTAGSNTFTAKYRAGSGGTASYEDRDIFVIPL